MPPEMYTNLILVPAILHIDALVFADYPPVMKAAIRAWLPYYIAGGQGLNPQVISNG